MTQGYLRKAVIEDMDLLYEWTNEEAVRKNSLNTEQIPWEAHKNWFLDRLTRVDCDMFIYLLEDKPVGQIRLEYRDGCAWVSFSIAKEHRGQGHGGAILRLAEEAIRQLRPENKMIAGVVKKNNIASQKKFINLNYSCSEDPTDADLLLFKKQLS